jgi:glycoside/pentoside/hexuronide:cation symporter, GPH family
MSLPVVSPHGRLPWSRRLGFGAADFGFNLFFATASLYLLFYYTDVLGLSPSTAGWVFAVALMWDALFDPAMGYIASRTRTRWGSYRPYLLFGGVPLALSWALLFLPVEFEGTALTIFAACTHMLFRTLYAVVSMPYLALSAAMTNDSKERGFLASLRMMAASSCAILSALFTLEFVEFFGGGRIGFFWTACLYGAVAVVIFIISFATVREVERPEAEKMPTVADMQKMLAGNRAFWIVCAAMLLGGIGGTTLNKVIPYYFKYALMREDLIGAALGATAAAVFVSMPFWNWLMTRTSKRVMWLSGTIIGLLGYVAFWFAPPDPYFIIPIMMILGVGGGAGYLGFWAMMPDTVEYGEWRSGIRSEGAIFGFVSLIQKGALGLAAAGLGEVLESIGYIANQAQSPQTLDELKLIMLAFPAAMALGAGIAISFYPITPKLHERLVRAINWRRRVSV